MKYASLALALFIAQAAAAEEACHWDGKTIKPGESVYIQDPAMVQL